MTAPLTAAGEVQPPVGHTCTGSGVHWVGHRATSGEALVAVGTLDQVGRTVSSGCFAGERKKKIITC